MELLAGRHPRTQAAALEDGPGSGAPSVPHAGGLSSHKLSAQGQAPGTEDVWASWTLVIQAHRDTRRIQLGPWRLLKTGSDQTLGQPPGR